MDTASDHLSYPVKCGFATDYPAIRFGQGTYFRAYWFTIAAAHQVARPPLTDPTGCYPSHEGF
jgi:hypothetical protein